MRGIKHESKRASIDGEQMDEIWTYIAYNEAVNSMVNLKLGEGWKLLGAPLPVPMPNRTVMTNLILVTMYKPSVPETVGKTS